MSLPVDPRGPESQLQRDCERGDRLASAGFDTGRFGRLLALIPMVTAIALFTSSQRLEGQLFQLAVLAIGGVAVVTAMIGVLIDVGRLRRHRVR